MTAGKTPPPGRRRRPRRALVDARGAVAGGLRRGRGHHRRRGHAGRGRRAPGARGARRHHGGPERPRGGRGPRPRDAGAVPAPRARAGRGRRAPQGRHVRRPGGGRQARRHDPAGARDPRGAGACRTRSRARERAPISWPMRWAAATGLRPSSRWASWSSATRSTATRRCACSHQRAGAAGLPSTRWRSPSSSRPRASPARRCRLARAMPGWRNW